MNPPPTPPRRGAARRGQFPSWEGSGVGLSPAGSWKSPHRFAAVPWDHEPRTSRTVPPTRCCRRLVGRASLTFLCRQDAGSTLELMESLHGIHQNSLAEYSKEIMQFFINLFRTSHRLRNLGADQFDVALTQPMHGHLDRPFAHAQGNSQIGIRSLASFAGEIILCL